MSLNKSRINKVTINKSDTSTTAFGFGTIIAFTQSLNTMGSGPVISITQNVGLYSSGSGQLIGIEQNIVTEGVGTVLRFEQDVIVKSSNTFFARNGYDVNLYISNRLIDRTLLCDQITVTRSEGSASTLTFSMYPSAGVQDPEEYLGESCFVNVQDNTGVSRIFTGWIDNPTLDLYERKIKFSCSDRRQTQINLLPNSSIAYLGLFSQYVTGVPTDQADELTKRLETVPASFDFDAFGNPTYTNWQAKSVPDYTISDSDIYYEGPNPTVIYSNRSKTVNTVNITINYRHERLHQQTCGVVWPGYSDFTLDWFTQGSPTFPQRAAINSAANSTSWYSMGSINYVSLWPAGDYGGELWQPNQVVNVYVPKLVTQLIPYASIDPSTGQTTYSLIWPDGNEHSQELTVIDPATGTAVMELQSQTITDTSSNLCRGASWSAAKRLTQTVIELYSISISSPSAVVKYGLIDQHDIVNMNDPYDTSGWLKDRTPYSPITIPGDAENAFINGEGYATGADSLTLLSSGNGSINIGNQFIISGDISGQLYTAASSIADVGSGGVLKLQSGLVSSLQAAPYQIVLIPETSNSTANFFTDIKPLYSQFQQAIEVALMRADTTLRKSFRDVTVNFKHSIWPEIDLQHTVDISAGEVDAKGKVSRISHYIDCQTGEAYSNISLLLTRSPGSDTQSTYSIQVPPYEDTSYIGTPSVVGLQTHFGINPDPNITPAVITWNGFIGNSNVKNQGPSSLATRTSYPESFKVGYPSIPFPITLDRTVTANTPGLNQGVTTDSAGYLQGDTSLNLASGGTGQILQGDSITIANDASGNTYTVLEDILNVSSGGILSISPGLGAALPNSPNAIITSPAANKFTIGIDSDDLTVTF